MRLCLISRKICLVIFFLLRQLGRGRKPTRNRLTAFPSARKNSACLAVWEPGAPGVRAPVTAGNSARHWPYRGCGTACWMPTNSARLPTYARLLRAGSTSSNSNLYRGSRKVNTRSRYNIVLHAGGGTGAPCLVAPDIAFACRVEGAAARDYNRAGNRFC